MTEIKIIYTGDSSQALTATKQLDDAINSLAGAPEKLTKSTTDVGKETANALGMTRREWMRTGSEAAFYMTAIAGKSGEMGQAISQAAGMVTQLGESFMFGDVAGVAIAAVGLGISLLVAQNPQLQALNNELDKLAKHDDAVSALAKLAGVEETQAQKAIAAAKESQSYAAMLKELSDAAQKPVGIMGELQDAISGVVDFFKQGIEAGGQFISLLLGAGAAGASLVASWKDGRSEAEANAAAMESMRRVMIGTKEQTDERTTAQNRLKAAVIDAGIAEDRLTRAAKNEGDLYDINAGKAKEYANAINQVANAQNAMLKSMLEKALTPTSVTGADMEATQAGTYTNKWDEFRRRIEAVQGGANPAQFGAEFEAALSKLNMPLDVAIEKFKNFSLFADPKNLKLVDWGSVTASIGEQLQSLVGKANLMKEGFAKAWASLSADQRKSLRELGIESAGDAKKALMGAGDAGVSGFVGQINDKETVKQLKGAGDSLVKNVQAGMLDKETMKIWAGGIDALVLKVQDQFANKDNLKILKDAGTAMLEQIASGFKESSALTDAMMAAVSDAINDAIEWLKGNFSSSGGAPLGAAVPVPAVPGFASGGMGIFARGGMVRVDDGEGYMFTGRGGGLPRLGGGANVTIVYSPQVSLASQSEAVGVIAPIVQRAIREAQSRKT